MTLRFKIYAVLITLSILFNIYKEDATGVILSLLVLPMCWMGKPPEGK